MTANIKDDELTLVIKNVIESLRNSETPAAYRDPRGSAKHLGVSLRQFETFAREIPCHRFTARGKRLYGVADLDAFMARHRRAPINGARLDAIVDDVFGSIVDGQKSNRT